MEEMIDKYPVASIARKLGRSFAATNIKLNRMGLVGFEKSTDLLTLNHVCLMFSVDYKTIHRKWIKKGFRLIKKGKYRCVRQEDLIKYLEAHPEDWNAAKVTDDSLIMSYPWYKEKRKTDSNESYFWTQKEVSRMKTLRHQGYSIREIAEKLGRSESSIKFKLYRG